MADHPFALDGKVALVTGSNQGLGLEIALSFAAAGARVLLNGRDEAKIGKARERFRAAGLEAESAAFDVTDTDEAARVIDTAAEAGAPIDILVNNVGRRDRRAYTEISPELFTELLQVNLVAPYALSRLVSAQLIRLGRPGRIINISSIGASLGGPADATYPTAKAGLEGMTRAFAAALGPHEITVNALAPGNFATETNQEMVENEQYRGYLQLRASIGRWGRPEEITGAALFLASDAASYVTGQTITVDGGLTKHL